MRPDRWFNRRRSRHNGGAVRQCLPRQSGAAIFLPQIFARFLAILVAVMLTGCVLVPPPVDFGHGQAPDTLAVSRSLAEWPVWCQRHFTGTLRYCGQRTAVMGFWHYRSPWRFRFVLQRVNGQALFAVRANWAGLHILQLGTGVSRKLALAVGRDLSLATRRPRGLGSMDALRHVTRISTVDPWGHAITWEFAGLAGRLLQLQVVRPSGNMLTVQYRQYNLRGWPGVMALYRPALNYALVLHFGRR